MKQINHTSETKESIYQNDDAALLWGKDSGISKRKGLKKIVKDNHFGVKLLPDCKEFRITLGQENILYKTLGISLKEKPRIAIDPYRNRGANRYVIRQLLRLKQSIGQPVLFWRIAWSLMGSSSFIVMTLGKSLPNWEKDYPYRVVLEAVREVKSLVRSRSYSLDYHRVYIPKSDGKVRPLGVPILPWRIYLAMYSSVLRILLYDYFPASQHAYLPGRGVVSAWQEIVNKVLNQKDIYEFDLKQFFPSVNVKYIIEMLKIEFGLPSSEVEFIKGICRQTPTLPKTHLLDESKILKKKSINMGGDYVQWWWGTNSDIAKLFNIRTSNGQANRAYHIWDRARVKYLLHKRDVIGYTKPRPAGFNETWARDDFYQRVYYEGVAQGTPLAPLLSILALVMPLQEQVNTVMYADDGVIYGRDLPDEPFPDTFDVHESGIKLHEEKSGWVKRAGRWLRPLKFLGMEFDGLTGRFSANTRNGAKLEWSDEVKFITWLSSQPWSSRELITSSCTAQHRLSFEEIVDRHWKDFSTANWNELFENKYIGFIFSRLQSDSWHQEVEQDFGLAFVKGSWMDVSSVWYCGRENLLGGINTFNSSTFASHCLINDLKNGYAYRDRRSLLKGIYFLHPKIRTLLSKVHRKVRYCLS